MNYFLDDDYYASKDYNLQDIKVPLLSVANWGGILLHLRGNIEGMLFYSIKIRSPLDLCCPLLKVVVRFLMEIIF
jgi:hypothetical protein